MNRKINSKGLAIIQTYEGCKLEAYKDIVGVLTIGFGHTGSDVKPGMVITPERAVELLKQDVEYFETHVDFDLQGTVCTDNQFSACVSLAYNIGLGNFQASSVLRRMKNGNFTGAADAFLMWNKAGGQELRGLTRRRQAERKLFLMAD